MLRHRLPVHVVLFVSAAFPPSMAIGAEPAKAICETMEACIQRLRDVSGSKSGVDNNDRLLVDRLLSFGPPIVPALVDVLADPNESAAELAGYALRETPRIEMHFLPQIIAGLDRGLGWLAPALCRMDSDEAAREAVARFTVSESAPHNQEAYALRLCAARAIPHIVEAARCRTPCDPALHYNLGSVLADMGEERAAAAPGLMDIAADPNVPRDMATGALHMIGALGEIANSLEPELVNLRKRRPELESAIEDALIGIGSQASGEIYAERLTAAPDYIVLRDLAEVGRAGVGAGPTVVRLLGSEDWNLRLAAARALGYIGYADASQPLIDLLDDPTDVRMNWVAAESLGRLLANDALPALRHVAQRHWYPPVRNAATAAIEHIETRTQYQSELHRRNFALEFFDYEHLGRTQPICEKPLLASASEPTGKKVYASETPGKIEKLAFETVVFSYGPAVEPEPNADGTDEVIELTPDNTIEHRSPTRQVPHVALRVDNGWLAGSNRGEWGGELVFIADDGTQRILLHENVEDIYVMGDQAIALTGLAHLSSNRGVVHALFRDELGDWSTRPWRALPGAPATSWIVETGELLINAASGGTLLLGQDGSFRLAPCADRESADDGALNH